jgi:hypothetical protein
MILRGRYGDLGREFRGLNFVLLLESWNNEIILRKSSK